MNYQDHAYALLENGFASIPLTHAKGTTVKWGAIQKARMSEKTVDWYCTRRWFSPDLGRKILGGSCERIGLVHGDVYGYASVDIDITDKKIAAQVDTLARKHLPDTPLVRVGLAPKQLLMFRTDGSIKSRKFHGVGIEIFASSGQIAAFGIHPKTGNPYDWVYGESPLTTPVSKLPPLDQKTLDEFLTAVSGVPMPNRTVGGGGGGTGRQILDFFEEMAMARKLGDPVQACIRQIQNVTDGTRNPTLMSVIGYLDAQDEDSDDIAAFVDKWFPDDQRTDEFDDVYNVALDIAERTRDKFDDVGVAL